MGWGLEEIEKQEKQTPAVIAVTARKFPAAVMRDVLAAQNRERKRIASHLGMVRGLMPLLMKRRNGSRWSAAEREDLYRQLRALSHLSPYLLVLVLPGSFLMLPVLAWWLDRRRGVR